MKKLTVQKIKTELSRRLEEFYRQIQFIILSKYRLAISLLQNSGYKKTVLFYPEKPRYFHLLYLICHKLGYRITNNPNAAADVVISFEDSTTRSVDEGLSVLAARRKVVNEFCDDISKVKVEKVFHEVFGYGMALDPRTYSGICVEKSDENARHDGKIIRCPVEPKAGFIYQKLISTGNGSEVVDMRIPVFNDKIPFILYRHKSSENHFTGLVRAVLVETDEALSKEEQKKIIAFCQRFGMDYGELDVLRDNDDGRIYIVDANKTPAGPWPGKHLSKAAYQEFINRLSDAFESEIVGVAKAPSVALLTTQ